MFHSILLSWWKRYPMFLWIMTPHKERGQHFILELYNLENTNLWLFHRTWYHLVPNVFTQVVFLIFSRKEVDIQKLLYYLDLAAMQDVKSLIVHAHFLLMQRYMWSIYFQVSLTLMKLGNISCKSMQYCLACMNKFLSMINSNVH
jgi:hypothetical protein